MTHHMTPSTAVRSFMIIATRYVLFSAFPDIAGDPVINSEASQIAVSPAISE